MNDSKKENKRNNIIYFPGVKEQLEQKRIEVKKFDEDRSIQQVYNFFQYKDSQEQMFIAKKLKDSNIVPYIEGIKGYLQSKDGDLFFKTLMINVLKEHQYDKPIEIEKFEKQISIIPKFLSDLSENNEINEIRKMIEKNLENEDPILFESIQSLMNRHAFLLYPFPLDFLELSAWAAAYHELGNEYFGNTHTENELLEMYAVKQLAMRKAKLFINKIEEISYRNM